MMYFLDFLGSFLVISAIFENFHIFCQMASYEYAFDYIQNLMGQFSRKMHCRPVFGAARGCDALSQIFKVAFNKLGQNQNFDTSTSQMGLQTKEKFSFLKSDQKSMTSLLRVTEVLPLVGPLQNHFQNFILSKI